MVEKIWSIPVSSWVRYQTGNPFSSRFEIGQFGAKDFILEYEIKDNYRLKLATQNSWRSTISDGKKLAFLPSSTRLAYVMDYPNRWNRNESQPINFTEAMPSWNPDGFN